MSHDQDRLPGSFRRVAQARAEAREMRRHLELRAQRAEEEVERLRAELAQPKRSR